MATRRVLITVLAALAWVAFGMASVPREVAAAPGDISVVVESDRGYYPTALAVDAAGNMYFADWNTNQVFVLVPATGQITRVAGNGAQDYSGDGGPATEASLNYSNALAVDAGGNLYISDGWNGRVRKVDAATGRISTVAGNGTFIFPGNNGDGGLATDARLLLDTAPGGGLAFDGAGNLYISDGNPGYNGGTGWLRKVDAATGLISTAATTAIWGSASPLAGDGAGNLYFVDWVPTPGWDPRYGAQFIRKLGTATGAMSTVGEVSDLAGPVDDFRSLYGMAVDNAGNLYYSTDESGKVYKVALSTGVKTELPVGAYHSAYKMYLPLSQAYDLAVNRAGDLYIADTWDGRILKVEGNSAPPANQPPVANNDAATTNEDAALAIAVLANDSDPNGDALTVTGVTSPAHGAAAINLDGTLTYTPAPDFNGSDTFTYTISDGQGGTATGAVSVTVTPVNDAPSFTKGADQAGAEDAGPQSVASWATNISAGPPDEAGQTLDFLVSNDNPGLFSAQPAIDPSGRLTYTAVADANGFATVTVQLRDNGGTANGGVDTSAPQTFTIEVIPVNDAPSFVKGADQTVAEDAVAQSVAGWATNLSAGPPDEAGQTLNFLVSNDNNGLFSAPPAVDASGALTYAPAANASGTANVTVRIHDNGGTDKGGVDTSAPQSFAITVAHVNQPPVAVDDAVTTEEDAGVTVDVLANDTDADGGTLTLTGVTDPDRGSADLNPDGTLTYTPDPDLNGSDSFTYTLSDGQGGTATATIAVTVNPVNDPPTFVQGADQVVDEDAGAQVAPGWATQISPGPADEATQTVAFAVTGGDESLFAVLPAIAADGTLTYTPVPDASGSAKLMVSLRDDGGGAPSKGKGDKKGLGQVFVITVNPVNDAPSFTKGTDQEVLDNAGPQSVANWATDLSAGPVDEAGQTLDFLVSNDNDGLFAVQPAVDASGTLTYAPAPNASGTANVTVRIHDGGGTDKGGVDTSAPQSFAIAVKLSNRPPAANAGADQHLEAAGPTTAVQLDGSGSSDPDGDVLSYSWSENGALVSAQASPTLTLAKGSHTFVLTVADSRGGSASDEVVVTIVDTTPPALTLTGANPLLLELGTSYTEPGATATDLVDGDLTGNIQVSGGVDANTEGTYTITYAAHDDAGNSASATRTVQVVVTPNSYGLIATHSLHLRQNAQVHSGFVGVVNRGQAPFLAGKVELVVGTKVQTAEDVRLSAPRVQVRQHANIEGELVYTDLVSVGKRATIAHQEQVGPEHFPLFQGFGLPAFLSGTPGARDVEVRQKGSATLAAGSYDEIRVKQKGTLTFTGGTYQLGDLEVGQQAKVLFLAPTTLLIRGQLSLDQKASFGPGSGIDASDILVYVEGRNGRLGNHHDDDEGDDEEDDSEGRRLRQSPRSVKVGEQASFQGNLYAPNGTIHLRQGSLAVGSFIGKDIIVGVRAQVAAQSGWNTPGVIYQPQAPAPLAKLAGTQGEEAALPSGTGLLANYPNPFNPSTTVPYVLAEAGLVKLSVYNVLGQQIRVLVDQLQVPGSYTVSWDGMDAAGLQVAGGVYFYRLEASDHIQVKKMLFAK